MLNDEGSAVDAAEEFQTHIHKFAYAGDRVRIFCEHSNDALLEGTRMVTMVREGDLKLVHFVDVFPHPGLTLELLLVEIEEVRLPPLRNRRTRKPYRVEDRRLGVPDP